MDNKLYAVADFFLANASPDITITSHTLQRLCAYAQGFSLGLRGKPLFEDEIWARRYGPVFRRFSYWYRIKRRFPNTGKDVEASRRPFNDEELYILETINSYYGNRKTKWLRQQAKKDFPCDFRLLCTLEMRLMSKENLLRQFRQHKGVMAIRDAIGGSK